MALCPVCRMTVENPHAARQAAFRGKTYHFCSPHCLEAFQEHPSHYVGGNFLQRFLHRLQQENQSQFGQKGPRCH